MGATASGPKYTAGQLSISTLGQETWYMVPDLLMECYTIMRIILRSDLRDLLTAVFV